MDPVALAQLLQRLPHCLGRGDWPITSLSGGITNRNYRIDVNAESFVLRVNGANTDWLGIQRGQEHLATRHAAEAGIGPEVVYVLEPEGYLVTRFIAGQPIPPEQMRRPENLQRVAQTLRRVHALPPIAATFSPFRIVESYEVTARRFGVTAFPDHYAELRAYANEIERTFLAEPFAPALCHNDLLNENFLDDGALRILDWEYAGMGDVFFDLANFAVNHGLDEDQDRLLLDAYFAPATSRHFTRLKHMRCMSDFREALWALVQLGVSQLDFDFKAYADKHFARLTNGMATDGFAKRM